jgi:hypothetical protein
MNQCISRIDTRFAQENEVQLKDASLFRIFHQMDQMFGDEIIEQYLDTIQVKIYEFYKTKSLEDLTKMLINQGKYYS